LIPNSDTKILLLVVNKYNEYGFGCSIMLCVIKNEIVTVLFVMHYRGTSHVGLMIRIKFKIFFTLNFS